MDPQQARRRADIARALGFDVIESEPIEIGGSMFPVWEVYCDDNEDAVRLFAALAQDDALTPAIRRLARHFRRVAERMPGVSVERETAGQIQRYVQSLRFQPEETETIRSAQATLLLRAGDCDDHAYLSVALALAAGLDAWIEPMRDASGEITHVAFAARVDGATIWLETTIAADIGEHPQAAAARLGAARSDILG